MAPWRPDNVMESGVVTVTAPRVAANWARSPAMYSFGSETADDSPNERSDCHRARRVSASSVMEAVAVNSVRATAIPAARASPPCFVVDGKSMAGV